MWFFGLISFCTTEKNYIHVPPAAKQKYWNGKDEQTTTHSTNNNSQIHTFWNGCEKFCSRWTHCTRAKKTRHHCKTKSVTEFSMCNNCKVASMDCILRVLTWKFQSEHASQKNYELNTHLKSVHKENFQLWIWNNLLDIPHNFLLFLQILLCILKPKNYLSSTKTVFFCLQDVDMLVSWCEVTQQPWKIFIPSKAFYTATVGNNKTSI